MKHFSMFWLAVVVFFHLCPMSASEPWPGYGPGSGNSPALQRMLEGRAQKNPCDIGTLQQQRECHRREMLREREESRQWMKESQERRQKALVEEAKKSAEREAEQRATAARQEAKDQKELALALEKRDAADVIAQVLNYTTTGVDEGTQYDFWFKADPSKPCVYQRTGKSKSILGVVAAAYDRMANSGVIDLNLIDPRGLSVQDTEVGKLPVTMVVYDATPLMISSRQLDHERLSRGWNMIYQEGHCEGRKRAF